MNIDPKKDNSELEAYLSDLEHNYEEFKIPVGVLIDSLNRRSADVGASNFLGEGKLSSAYRITIGKKPYVVRVLKDMDTADRMVRGYAKGSFPSVGLDGFEQIRAISYSDGVTIADMMPGTLCDDLPRSSSKIPDKHLDQLFRLAEMAHEKGVIIDLIGDNILYDRKHGFGIIDSSDADLFTEDDAEFLERSLGDLVGDISVALFSMSGSVLGPLNTRADYQEAAKRNQHNSHLLSRYRKIVGMKTKGHERDKAFARIDELISVTDSAAKQYTEEQWLSQFE